ncbi:ROK family protein [Bacillus sp. HNA3]|uniref:ROK family protein n=1 Tax=Bacillus sp. HNA3 TaxID=2585772 RepID=UPI0032B4B8B8
MQLRKPRLLGIVCFREGFSNISSDEREKSVQPRYHRPRHLNDVGTLQALQNFGFYLGIGLTNILNTFNPQAII